MPIKSSLFSYTSEVSAAIYQLFPLVVGISKGLTSCFSCLSTTTSQFNQRPASSASIVAPINHFRAGQVVSPLIYISGKCRLGSSIWFNIALSDALTPYLFVYSSPLVVTPIKSNPVVILDFCLDRRPSCQSSRTAFNIPWR